MSHTKSELSPIQSVLPAVLAEVLKAGPLSSAKIEFAWKAAVGGALARVTTARLGRPQTVEVTAADERGARELRRSAPTIVARLKALLGPDVVTRIEIVSAPSNSASRGLNSTTTANPRSHTPDSQSPTPNPRSRTPNPQSQVPDPDK